MNTLETQKEVPTRKPRATAAEKEERVNFVYGLIVGAQSRSEIIKLCREKYGVGRSVVDDAIRDATKQLAEDWKPVRKVEAEKAMQRLDFAYRRGMELGQVSAAIQAQAMICKIMGIGPEMVAANTKIGESITFTLHRRESQTLEWRYSNNAIESVEEEDNSDLVMEPIGL